METWKIILIAFFTAYITNQIIAYLTKENKFLVTYLIKGSKLKTSTFIFESNNLTLTKIKSIIDKIVEVENLEDSKEVVILNINNLKK